MTPETHFGAVGIQNTLIDAMGIDENLQFQSLINALTNRAESNQRSSLHVSTLNDTAKNTTSLI
jgi:hypothetical protein